MAKRKLSANGLFIMFLIVASIVVYFIVRNIDTKEPFYDGCMGSKCICNGMSGHVCINSQTAQSFYNAGLITENTIPPNGVAHPQYMQSGPMCY
jgi:hypothetical protein